jgi:hypothetical protein
VIGGVDDLVEELLGGIIIGRCCNPDDEDHDDSGDWPSSW